MKDVQKGCSVPEVGPNVTLELFIKRIELDRTKWFWFRKSDGAQKFATVWVF